MRCRSRGWVRPISQSGFGPDDCCTDMVGSFTPLSAPPGNGACGAGFHFTIREYAKAATHRRGDFAMFVVAIAEQKQKLLCGESRDMVSVTSELPSERSRCLRDRSMRS